MIMRVHLNEKDDGDNNMMTRVAIGLMLSHSLRLEKCLGALAIFV